MRSQIVGAYWKRALARAHRDTLALLGYQDLSRAWVSILVFIATLAIIYIFIGFTPMSDSLRAGLAAFGAIVATYPLLLDYNLIRIPDRLDREISQKIRELKQDLKRCNLVVFEEHSNEIHIHRGDTSAIEKTISLPPGTKFVEWRKCQE